MNFEELAINDWVLWNGEPNQVIGLESGTLYFKTDEKDLRSMISEDVATPMPLTRDILNENKFNYNTILGSYDKLIGFNLRIRLLRKNDKEWGLFLGDSEKNEIITSIRYVHELQCILRAYKEYEMAKSFKV